MSATTLDGMAINRLTAEQRVKAFKIRFPNFLAPSIHNDVLYVTWVIGALYKRSNGYYGAYPHMVLERILALFPDCSKVAHLFSGTLKSENPETITYDVNADLNPVICDGIKNIVNHASDLQQVQLFVADPPYDAQDFERYGVSPFDKAQAVRLIGNVAQKGAYLAWLDTKVPMYNKDTWRLMAHLALVVSTNTRVRMWTIWERS